MCNIVSAVTKTLPTCEYISARSRQHLDLNTQCHYMVEVCIKKYYDIIDTSIYMIMLKVKELWRRNVFLRPNFFFFFSIISSSSSFLFSHASISLASTKTFYRFTTWEELWQDSKFLYGFFSLFPNQNERAILAQVCQKWREVLYQPVFWRDVRPVIHCRAIRSWSTSVASYCTNTSSSTATSSASNQSITNSSFSNNEIRSTITCEVNSNNTTTNNTTNNAIAATDMQQTTASDAVVTSPASTTGNIDKKYT